MPSPPKAVRLSSSAEEFQTPVEGEEGDALPEDEVISLAERPKPDLVVTSLHSRPVVEDKQALRSEYMNIRSLVCINREYGQELRQAWML